MSDTGKTAEERAPARYSAVGTLGAAGLCEPSPGLGDVMVSRGPRRLQQSLLANGCTEKIAGSAARISDREVCSGLSPAAVCFIFFLPNQAL